MAYNLSKNYGISLSIACYSPMKWSNWHITWVTAWSFSSVIGAKRIPSFGKRQDYLEWSMKPRMNALTALKIIRFFGWNSYLLKRFTRETYDEFFPRNFNLPLFVIVLFLSWACRFTWNRSSLLVLKSWATNFNQSD